MSLVLIAVLVVGIWTGIWLVGRGVSALPLSGLTGTAVVLGMVLIHQSAGVQGNLMRAGVILVMFGLLAGLSALVTLIVRMLTGPTK